MTKRASTFEQSHWAKHEKPLFRSLGRDVRVLDKTLKASGDSVQAGILCFGLLRVLGQSWGFWYGGWGWRQSLEQPGGGVRRKGRPTMGLFTL